MMEGGFSIQISSYGIEIAIAVMNETGRAASSRREYTRLIHACRYNGERKVDIGDQCQESSLQFATDKGQLYLRS